MKKSIFSSIFFLFSLSILLSSCAAIESIFKAGMGFGIFMVLIVVGVILFIIMRVRKK